MDSTTGSTADGSVPSGPQGSLDARDRHPFSIALSVAAALAVLFVYLANTWTLPYYRIAPGSAFDTALLVSVDDAHYFEPEGKVLLTTVALGKVTLVEALQGWLDPAVDVVKERVIAPPDVDEDELRELNLRDMEESKNKALGVAFEYLGVDAIRGAGAEIVEIVAGTPADGVLDVGDTIVAVDVTPVALDGDAVAALGSHTPGDPATLRVRAADGGERDVSVVLAEHPDQAGRAFLGVSLSTKDLQFDFPFQVEVRSEQIGGPSAGLAFTLEVLDILTDGELTGGRVVASTGTIELDGSVGAVGGVAQKTKTVRASGAELFLVPMNELERARRFAGDDLRVEGVDTLEDALRVLATVGGNGLALPPLADDAGPT